MFDLLDPVRIMKYFWILSVIAIVLVLDRVSANAKYRRLLRKLKSRADPDVIPLGSQKKAVNVTLQVSLIDITEVNLETGMIEIETWLTHMWNSKLTWDANRYEFKSVRMPASKMWTPDIDVFNGNRKLSNEAPEIAVIQSDGSVLMVSKTKMAAHCRITTKGLSYGQECIFKFGSWTYSASWVSLVKPSPVDLSLLNQSKYKVVDTEMIKVTDKYPCCPEDYETYELKITFQYQ